MLTVCKLVDQCEMELVQAAEASQDASANVYSYYGLKGCLRVCCGCRDQIDSCKEWLTATRWELFAILVKLCGKFQ